MNFNFFTALLIILLITSCKSENELAEIIGNTYSVENSLEWQSVLPDSQQLAGKCSIENGRVVYKKIQTDFNGTDACLKNNDPCEEYYGINFSESIPKLIRKNSSCL